MASIQQVRDAIARRFGKTHGGKRDTYEAFGYPNVITITEYYAMYERNAIAWRLINAFPAATWRKAPIVRDDDGATREESQFVRDWENLVEEFDVLRMMERADRLSSIGHFGVLLMGFEDGKALSEPLEGQPRLAYLAAHSERNVHVAKWEDRPDSPRFGLPIAYRIDFTGSNSRSQSSMSRLVHYTRVIHLAEHLDENDVYAVPRLKSVYNQLLDIHKLAGASAETFWLTANRGIALEADSNAELDEDALKDAREQAEDYKHQLTRVMGFRGMTAKSLGSETPDPSASFKVQLDMVAGSKGMPSRLLIGSERGELASSQDDDNWAAQIDERRAQFAAPSMIRPFVRTMVQTGNLPEPNGTFWVEWDHMASLSPQQAAEVGKQQMEALSAYTRSMGGDEVVPVSEFRTKILQWEAEPEGGFVDPDNEDGEGEE